MSALKKDEYWWIEDEKGKLAEYGRNLDFERGRKVIYEDGTPNLFISKETAENHCYEDENPVKVKIVKIRG
jgi:hypothetical protein